MKEHRFSLPFTSVGGEQRISLMKSFCLKQYSLRGTLTRVATVSVPIVAEICARRGAGFSRFLQLVPGEGESQTTGKLCVLHFLCKGQLNIASLAMDERSESGVQCESLNLTIELNCSTKIPRKRQ